MLKAESDIKTLTTNVRRLILKFTEQKKENTELYAMVDERDKQIAELQKRLSEAEKKYCGKHRRTQSLYHDLTYTVVGCPEVTQQDFILEKDIQKMDTATTFLKDLPVQISYANSEKANITLMAV